MLMLNPSLDHVLADTEDADQLAERAIRKASTIVMVEAFGFGLLSNLLSNDQIRSLLERSSL